MKRPMHKITEDGFTVCGLGKKTSADRAGTDWESTTCKKCLKGRPNKKSKK